MACSPRLRSSQRSSSTSLEFHRVAFPTVGSRSVKFCPLIAIASYRKLFMQFTCGAGSRNVTPFVSRWLQEARSLPLVGSRDVTRETFTLEEKARVLAEGAKLHGDGLRASRPRAHRRTPHRGAGPGLQAHQGCAHAIPPRPVSCSY